MQSPFTGARVLGSVRAASRHGFQWQIPCVQEAFAVRVSLTIHSSVSKQRRPCRSANNQCALTPAEALNPGKEPLLYVFKLGAYSPGTSLISRLITNVDNNIQKYNMRWTYTPHGLHQIPMLLSRLVWLGAILVTLTITWRL